MNVQAVSLAVCRSMVPMISPRARSGKAGVVEDEPAELGGGIGAQPIRLSPEPGDLRRHVDNSPITCRLVARLHAF